MVSGSALLRSIPLAPIFLNWFAIIAYPIHAMEPVDIHSKTAMPAPTYYLRVSEPASGRLEGYLCNGFDRRVSARTDLYQRILAARIMSRYCWEGFQNVESIRFTAREGRGGAEIVRQWIWFPAIDSVYFQGPDPKGLELQAGYSRKNEWSLGSETIAGIDRLFARDRMNLLFPVIFARDTLPDIRMGEGKWLLFSYPAGTAEGGKTYEVLADSDGTIRSWKAPGNETGSPGRRFDWARPKIVDGFPLSLERDGPKGSSIRFTDVKILRNQREER
jgi:hypothetical protein